MNRIHRIVLAGVALSLPLIASADPRIALNRDAQFRSIYSGETEQDVRDALGRPYQVRHQAGEKHLYYRVEDNFGERAWLDVALDGDNTVIRRGELRMLD